MPRGVPGVESSAASGEAGVSVGVVTKASVLGGVGMSESPEIADATPDKTSPTDDKTLPTPKSGEVELEETEELLESLEELSNEVTCLLTTRGK